MELKEIEACLNTVSFKKRVECLFSQPVRSKIDFEFYISVKAEQFDCIEVKAFDNSYDCDGIGIPSMVAIVPLSTVDDIEKSVLNQFKAEVELLGSYI